MLTHGIPPDFYEHMTREVMQPAEVVARLDARMSTSYDKRGLEPRPRGGNEKEAIVRITRENFRHNQSGRMQDGRDLGTNNIYSNRNTRVGLCCSRRSV